MKLTHFLIIVGAFITIFVILFAFFGPAEKNIVVRGAIGFGQFLVLTAQLSIIFAVPFSLGYYTRSLGIPALDNWILPREDMLWFYKLIILILASLLIGWIWVYIIPPLVEMEWTWMHILFVELGHPGFFETQPLGWGLVVAFTFLTGYFLNWFKENMTI